CSVATVRRLGDDGCDRSIFEWRCCLIERSFLDCFLAAADAKMADGRPAVMLTVGVFPDRAMAFLMHTAATTFHLPVNWRSIDCAVAVGGEQGAFLPTGQRRHLVAGEVERTVASAQHRRRVGIATRPPALREGNVESGSADAAVHLAGISRMYRLGDRPSGLVSEA
ncbi:MAG: hypothetical protein OXC11_00605, partial [Rhodospirillales bacterium]|nr:hypothetical protein [Rhodospirillales bacterium]